MEIGETWSGCAENGGSQIASCALGYVNQLYFSPDSETCPVYVVNYFFGRPLLMQSFVIRSIQRLWVFSGIDHAKKGQTVVTRWPSRPLAIHVHPTLASVRHATSRSHHSF
jgi:hypothetical protein